MHMERVMRLPVVIGTANGVLQRNIGIRSGGIYETKRPI